MNSSGMADGGIVVPDFLHSDFFNGSPPGLSLAAACCCFSSRRGTVVSKIRGSIRYNRELATLGTTGPALTEFS